MISPDKPFDLSTLEIMKAHVTQQVDIHLKNLKLIDQLIEAKKKAEELQTREESESIKESNKEEQDSQKEVLEDKEKEASRKRMSVFRCPHSDRKHYAKNMCNNCYHKQGRNKLAWLCEHGDRQAYAKGKCQNCYLNEYH